MEINATNVNVVKEDDEKSNTNVKSKKLQSILIAKIVISLLIAILSFTYISSIASSPKLHKSAIEMLDQKKITVMELSAGTALVANSASLALGDRALPVATKLMDLTGYFLLILCAIILEKYLLTILGLVSFKILLPVASLLFLANIFIGNKGLEKISIKLAIFSVVIFLVIPSSIGISRLIENTYSTNVQTLIDSTKEIKDDADIIIQEENENILEKPKDEIFDDEDIKKTDEGIFSRAGNFIGQIKDKSSNFIKNVKDNAINFVGTIGEKGKQLFTKTTTLLGNMIEVIAVMIVTTCIMPILVLLFFIWIIKMFFGLNIKTEDFKLPKIFK